MNSCTTWDQLSPRKRREQPEPSARSLRLAFNGPYTRWLRKRGLRDRIEDQVKISPNG